MIYISIVLLAIGLGYGAAYINSPTQHSELDVVATSIGFNDNEEAVVQVFFTVDLDKKPIFPKQHIVNITWSQGWKLDEYNIKKNGKFMDSNVRVSHQINSGNVSLPIDTEENLDGNDVGDGYIILTSDDKEMLSRIESSSVSVDFYYQSFIKDFKIADSTVWNNENVLH